MRTTIERWRGGIAATAMTLSLLAGCGGGGGGGGNGDSAGDGSGNGGGGTGAQAAVQLVAAGSSDRTASLAWQPITGATGYTVERKSAGGTFAPVATLAADADGFVDDGLAQGTAYTYRVVPAGAGTASTEQVATTTADAPIVTAAPATLGAATTASAGTSGLALTSGDGRARLELPAGALPAATEASLQPIGNPVPDGAGNGVRVHIGVRPSQPAKLALGYDATLDGQADGLGVAVRRADGSWLALPVAAVDKAARTLSVELPAALADELAGSGRVQAQSVPAAAASVSLDVDVVAYLEFYLSPRRSTIAAGATRLLVPYAHTQVQIGTVCPDETTNCLRRPLLDTREIVFENDKAGYRRAWYVEAIEGGSARLGTITPRSGTGAVYKAPGRAPSPNPVRVQFVSVHLKTNRTVGLSAMVEVHEPVWQGTIDGTLEQSADIGFGFSAQAVWAPANDDATVYLATGTQSVHVIDVTCNASPSPGTVPLPPGALTIDRSVEPARYSLDMGSLWNTTITGTCPGQGSASVGMTVPGRLQVEGSVGGNGTLIQGSTSINGIFWAWSLRAE